MTNDLLAKASALLEAREKATQGQVIIIDCRPKGERLTIGTQDFALCRIENRVKKEPLGEEDEANAAFFALAANTGTEIITGYQDLVRRMADALDLAGKALEDCMVSHAPGQDFAETVKISSKRQRIIASQESISKTLDEARAAIPPTPTNS
jgi:hypothetical protein